MLVESIIKRRFDFLLFAYLKKGICSFNLVVYMKCCFLKP
jgi:hypothetical protein